MGYQAVLVMVGARPKVYKKEVSLSRYHQLIPMIFLKTQY